MVKPIAAGATKSTNLILLLFDRKLGLTPEGKPLFSGINRQVVLVVPSENTKTGESASMVVGGYSADRMMLPGPYKVYDAGSPSVDRVERSEGTGGTSVDETWIAIGLDGSRLHLHIVFTRAVPVFGSFDVRAYSAADPMFCRIYRGEQVTDLVRSVNTGIDRVQTLELKVGGLRLMELRELLLRLPCPITVA